MSVARARQPTPAGHVLAGRPVEVVSAGAGAEARVADALHIYIHTYIKTEIVLTYSTQIHT